MPSVLEPAVIFVGPMIGVQVVTASQSLPQWGFCRDVLLRMCYPGFISTRPGISTILSLHSVSWQSPSVALTMFEKGNCAL